MVQSVFTRFHHTGEMQQKCNGLGANWARGLCSHYLLEGTQTPLANQDKPPNFENRQFCCGDYNLHVANLMESKFEHNKSALETQKSKCCARLNQISDNIGMAGGAPTFCAHSGGCGSGVVAQATTTHPLPTVLLCFPE